MTAQPPTPTPDDLVAGANHLLYEVQMLCNAASLLEDSNRWGHGWENKTLYMATLESFLTHVRGLMFFVCPTGSARERDIAATDYCTRSRTTKPWQGFDDDRNAIGRGIHHLSFDRPRIGRRWEYMRLAGELQRILDDFIERADLLPESIGAQIRAAFGGNRIGVAYVPPTLLAATPTTTLIDPSLVIEDGQPD